MQITLITPRRLMTLHLSHIGFTEALTFIEWVLLPYLYRYVILPRERSYGLNSSLT